MSEKKWFPGPVAMISLRKLDRYAEGFRSISPYFDTWLEAHQFLQTRAERRLAAAQKELPSAKRHLEKVRSMKAPEAPAERNSEGPSLLPGDPGQDEQERQEKQ